MASYSSPPTYKPSTYAAAQNPDVYAEDYDWVINKLRARGFKTLQDRRAEAEEQRKQRLAAWEAEKQRRRAAGENPGPARRPGKTRLVEGHEVAAGRPGRRKKMKNRGTS